MQKLCAHRSEGISVNPQLVSTIPVDLHPSAFRPFLASIEFRLPDAGEFLSVYLWAMLLEQGHQTSGAPLPPLGKEVSHRHANLMQAALVFSFCTRMAFPHIPVSPMWVVDQRGRGLPRGALVDDPNEAAQARPVPLDLDAATHVHLYGRLLATQDQGEVIRREAQGHVGLSPAPKVTATHKLHVTWGCQASLQWAQQPRTLCTSVNTNG